MRVGMILSMVVLAAVGCKGGNDGAADRGRGTDACRDFQDAACDFAADHCHAIGRGECDAMFQGIECKSDELATTCANNLNAASCSSPVPNCNLSQIADPQPAIDRCKTFVEHFCKRAIDCGQIANMASCDSQTAALGVECSQAISAELDYEDCLAEVDSLSCDAPRVPAKCMGVIRVIGNMTAAMPMP
jgi:hypothetical protein